MADEPPDIRLASSRDDLAVGRDRFEWELQFATEQLAANILRIIAEAGRPWELVDQVVAVRELLATAPEGYTVAQANDAIAEALSGTLGDDRDSDHDYAIELIEKGALRKVAAKLLRQQAQVHRRSADLWDGIYELERTRDTAKKRIEAERAAMKPLPRTRKAKAELARKIVAQKPKPAAAVEVVERRSIDVEPKNTVDFMRRRRREMRRDK
jgi:hypothetical protein